MATPADLLRTAAGSDPGRPFLTYYDDAAPERVELSFTTLDNWVAKTANLLVEEMDASPGEAVAVDLPTHWQTVVWYLACWAVGVVPAPGKDPAQADHAVTAPAGLDRARQCPGSVVLVGMRRFGEPVLAPPPGVLDYAAEVPAFGDVFAPMTTGGPALERDGTQLDGDALLAVANDYAHRWGLDRRSRVLTYADLGTEEGLYAGLLAPLVVGASVVLCRNLDGEAVGRRIASERVTVRV